VTADGRGPRATLLGVAWKVVASLAAFGALVLGVGVALPGTWSAERSTVVGAPPDSVFAWIEAPRRWDRWTPWGGLESTFSGPDRGAGATRSWDDPFMGEGTFTITASERPRRLEYRVEVEDGAMVTRGAFTLDAAGPASTRVTWRESGDFGWNPLMGYAALNMDRIQGTELERGLVRLRLLAETGTLPDSLELDRPAEGGRPAGPGAPSGPSAPRPTAPS
jgi:hypothetical protein